MVFYNFDAFTRFASGRGKGFYDTIPASLEEAARIDGCSRQRRRSVGILPLATPGLVITPALFSFMTAWSEYIVAAQVRQTKICSRCRWELKAFRPACRRSGGLYAAAIDPGEHPGRRRILDAEQYLVSGLTLGSVQRIAGD